MPNFPKVNIIAFLSDQNSTRTPWRLTFLYSSIFVFIYVLVYFSIAFFKGFNPLETSTWIRFDSGHYLAIAMNGYELFPCAGKFGYPENSNFWCGNTGWFPGYSILIFLITKSGVGFEASAIIISQLFLVAFAVVLTRLLNFNILNIQGLVLIAISALWTGGIYYASAFPISLVVFLIFLAIETYLGKKIFICSLVCLLASLSYSTGFLLGMALALVSLIYFENQKTRLTNTFIYAAASILGFAIYFIFLHYQFGVWNAFILVQEKYGHGFRFPFVSIIKYLLDFPIHGNVYNIMSYFQSIIEAGLFVLISVFVWRKRKYIGEMTLVAYLIYAFYFLFPWTVGGNLSHYRAESLLIPAVLLIKHKTLKFQYRLLCIHVILAIYIGAGFFMKSMV